MQKAPKPVETDDLKVGKWYFEVKFATDGNMSMGWIFTPALKKDGKGFKFFKGRALNIRVKLISDPKRTKDLSLPEIGVMRYAGGRDNFHRTFRYTARNYVFMETIVGEQNRKEYMKIIGVK